MDRKAVSLLLFMACITACGCWPTYTVTVSWFNFCNTGNPFYFVRYSCPTHTWAIECSFPLQVKCPARSYSRYWDCQARLAPTCCDYVCP